MKTAIEMQLAIGLRFSDASQSHPARDERSHLWKAREAEVNPVVSGCISASQRLVRIPKSQCRFGCWSQSFPYLRWYLCEVHRKGGMCKESQTWWWEADCICWMHSFRSDVWFHFEVRRASICSSGTCNPDSFQFKSPTAFGHQFLSRSRCWQVVGGDYVASYWLRLRHLWASCRHQCSIFKAFAENSKAGQTAEPSYTILS